MASEIVTLVDSNVLLDILTDDPTWVTWSSNALAGAFDDGRVVVNPIVYAEVSVGLDLIETSTPRCLPRSSSERHSPTLPDSWPAKRSSPTAAEAALDPPLFRTSTSVRTPPSPAIAC